MTQRLSDEELAWLEKRANDECPPQLARYVVALIGELRTRRAADYRTYPPEAELHCNRHGYYDGRRGDGECPECLVLERDVFMRKAEALDAELKKLLAAGGGE